MSRKVRGHVKRKLKGTGRSVERVEVRRVGVQVQELRLATGGGVTQQGQEDLVNVGAGGRVAEDGIVLVADLGSDGGGLRAHQRPSWKERR